MSRFYSEDLVEFEADPRISGLIYITWSDLDTTSPWNVEELHLHSSTPKIVLRTWREEGRLLPGYVIVEFMFEADGCCLAHEDALRLRDRSLYLGSIVKRVASDQQSGRVMSVSADCTLEPTCSIEEFAKARPIAAQSDQLNHARISNTFHQSSSQPPNVPDIEQKAILASYQEPKLVVPMADLSHVEEFWEGDHIVYQNSIGLVTSVHHEVTMRLANGSVVVVENAAELEVPSSVPGSLSYSLSQRLGFAGYHDSCQDCHKSYARRESKEKRTAWGFPGQYVRTKKGNLRRGRWKFGAYDPNVEPEGLVVDIRVVALQVDILFTNDAGNQQSPDSMPSITLSTDDLERGKVKLYDHSRLPSNLLARSLAHGNTQIDKEYGRSVRLKNAASAALKNAGKFKEISRTETQGYDMNVFLVTATQSKALVFWQDGSFSEEETTSLLASAETDQIDIWPGDRVSLRSDEMDLDADSSNSTSKLHIRTVGVVQTVNPNERLAQVRWFENSDIKLDPSKEKVTGAYFTSLDYGTIGDRISEVSLYEVSAYDTLEPNLGDLALPLPTLTSWTPKSSHSWGEVVGLCLDGDVILRCHNAPEPYDLKVGPSNMMIIYGVNSEEDEGDPYDPLAGETLDEEGNPKPLDVQIEYQGGSRMDIDGDEDAWSTDDEMCDSSTTLNPSSKPRNDVVDPYLRTENQTITDTIDVDGDGRFSSAEVSEQSLIPQRVDPSSFHILSETPPSDHHYFGEQGTSTANLAKAITRQYAILQSSLPEGIFVRAWESRLDLLRVLIMGPIGTPYEHAPFLFDMYLPTSFPDDPPRVFFHSWNNYLGRMNPNLYEDGKVCLSLLGTWPADEKCEGWSRKSTILQVLVSITGLILVKEPYYNETGYEVLRGSESSDVASRIYSEKVFIMAKAFVAKALSEPPNALQDVIDWLYCSSSGPQLLHRIILEYNTIAPGEGILDTCLPDDALLDGDDGVNKDKSWAEANGRLSAGAKISLKRHIGYLIEYEGHLSDKKPRDIPDTVADEKMGNSN